jgi:hypothetical protein
MKIPHPTLELIKTQRDKKKRAYGKLRLMQQAEELIPKKRNHVSTEVS